MKIRSIAGTLLDAPEQRKGELEMQNQVYLETFLKILVRLERAGPAGNGSSQTDDEEAELQSWADLQEYQLKFAQQGGLVGLS
jgi:hypothetical protein